MRKNFIFNFVISLVVYIAVMSVSAVLAHIGEHRSWLAWGILPAASTIFAIVGYCLLKDLNSHKWNLLSFSGGFLCSTIIISIDIVHRSEIPEVLFSEPISWSIIISSSFMVWTMGFVEILGVVGFYATAMLPIMFMWLGMSFARNKEDNSKGIGFFAILIPHIGFGLIYGGIIWIAPHLIVASIAIWRGIKVNMKTGEYGVGLACGIIGLIMTFGITAIVWPASGALS